MDNIDKYMNENYQLNILKIEDDGDNYYKVSVPDLPGLIISVSYTHLTLPTKRIV